MPGNRYVAFGDIRTGTSNLCAHPAIGGGAKKTDYALYKRSGVEFSVFI